MPLVPLALTLAEVVETTDGVPMFLRTSDGSPTAELFPTGIFIIRDVPPGTYGLTVDLGYTEFSLVDESGDLVMITVEAGETVDLGQVITQIP